ncbi:hypothetical protein GCM10020331_053100 [Ectobacillus funiculus]
MKNMDGELENYKAEAEKQITLLQIKLTTNEAEMEKQNKLLTTKKITDYEKLP